MPDTVDEILTRLNEIRVTMIKPDVAQETERGNPWNFGGFYSSGWCQAEPREEEVEETVDIDVVE